MCLSNRPSARTQSDLKAGSNASAFAGVAGAMRPGVWRECPRPSGEPDPEAPTFGIRACATRRNSHTRLLCPCFDRASMRKAVPETRRGRPNRPAIFSAWMRLSEVSWLVPLATEYVTAVSWLLMLIKLHSTLQLTFTCINEAERRRAARRGDSGGMRKPKWRCTQGRVSGWLDDAAAPRKDARWPRPAIPEWPRGEASRLRPPGRFRP